MACCTSVASNTSVVRKTNGSKICIECDQAVYPLEQVSAGQFTYHKWCFKCAQCNRTLSTSSYAVAPSGIPYCKPHYTAARNLRGGFEAFAVSYMTPSTSIQNLSKLAGQAESQTVRWSTTPHIPQPVNRTPVTGIATPTDSFGSSGSINSNVSSGGSDAEDDGPSDSGRCSNVRRVKAMFEMQYRQ